MKWLFLSFTFAMLSFACCYNLPFRAVRDIDETCPLEPCLKRKIDIENAFQDNVNLTFSGTGVRFRFKEGLFRFSCSVFDMFRACVDDLSILELLGCMSTDELGTLLRVLPAIDNTVCSKDQRLDTLIPCMNDDKVQESIFASLQFMESFKRKGGQDCSELKKKYIDIVTTLSKSCNNDGLAALLEILNELMTKLQDVVLSELMAMGTIPNETCLYDLQKATVTAKSLLSN